MGLVKGAGSDFPTRARLLSAPCGGAVLDGATQFASAAMTARTSNRCIVASPGFDAMKQYLHNVTRTEAALQVAGRIEAFKARVAFNGPPLADDDAQPSLRPEP